MNKYLEKVANYSTVHNYLKEHERGHGTAIMNGLRASGRGALESFAGGVAGGAVGSLASVLTGGRGATIAPAVGSLVGSLAGGIHGVGRSIQNQVGISPKEDKVGIVNRAFRANGRGLLESVGFGIPTGGLLAIPGGLHGMGRSIQNQKVENRIEHHKQAEFSENFPRSAASTEKINAHYKNKMVPYQQKGILQRAVGMVKKHPIVAAGSVAALAGSGYVGNKYLRRQKEDSKDKNQ